MRPESPGLISGLAKDILHRDLFVVAVEANEEIFRELLATPHHPDYEVGDFATYGPFLDADRHRGLVHVRGDIIFRQEVTAALMGAGRKLEHLARRGGGVVDQLDAINPLDAAASVPARDNETDGKAVVTWEALTIHVGG